jgi:hypothetical protein
VSRKCDCSSDFAAPFLVLSRFYAPDGKDLGTAVGTSVAGAVLGRGLSMLSVANPATTRPDTASTCTASANRAAGADTPTCVDPADRSSGRVRRAAQTGCAAAGGWRAAEAAPAPRAQRAPACTSAPGCAALRCVGTARMGRKIGGLRRAAYKERREQHRQM